MRETVSGKTQCFMLVPGEIVTYQVNPWDALEGHPQWDVKPTKDTATLRFKFKPLDNTVLPTIKFCYSIAINEMRCGQNALGNICPYNIVEDGLVNMKVKAFKKNEVTGDYKPRNFNFYAPNQNGKLWRCFKFITNSYP